MKEQNATNQALSILGILLAMMSYYHNFYNSFNDLLIYAIYYNMIFGVLFCLIAIISITFWIMSFGYLSKILLNVSFIKASKKTIIVARKRGMTYMYMSIALILVNLAMTLYMKQIFQI